MSNIKINPDLFLGAAELNRLKKFVDDDGFRKNIIDNSVSFGLIKNKFTDPLFNNAKVLRDLDTELGQRTIKVRQIAGIDKNGNFLSKPETDGILVSNDNNWYWVRISFVATNIEKGSFTISPNGDLVCTSGDAELTKIFRGMPNFPSRISFANSSLNTLEYDVIDVIDDNHATIQHPATNAYGISEFSAESSLQLKIVGTFSRGITVPDVIKYPFNYDSATITLVQELFLNTPPTATADIDFYIARIKSDQNTVIIQDKRLNYWETKGSSLPIEIERKANPCIGIETAQYNSIFTAEDRNIVKLSWGMRSNNWSVDSSNNIVTFASATGGKFKDVSYFTNGDFDGWKLYFPNGKYRKILTSVKQGSAINFILDVLDVNDTSNDGGTTFVSGYMYAVPDCEEVEILFTPNPTDNSSAFVESFVFPVNELPARMDVLVYADPFVLYQVKYRYKTGKDYTGWLTIPSDPIGYLNELSFDTNGNQKPNEDLVYYPYIANDTTGFIKLFCSPDSLRKFKDKIDKGDVIGVWNITDTSTTTVIDMIVGVTKNYIYLTGTLGISNDIYFNLKTATAVEGNQFIIHINADSFSLAGNTIFIVQNYNTLNQKILKEINIGDMYQMRNRTGGIVFTCKYKTENDDEWFISQNYELGIPGEVKTVDGFIVDLFDNAGMGKVIGLYGYGVMNGSNGLPDIREKFLVAANPANVLFQEKATGGAATHKLTSDEQGTFDIAQFTDDAGGGAAQVVAAIIVNGELVPKDGAADQGGVGSTITVHLTEAQNAHENLPPYYAIIYVKKVGW